MPTGGCGASLRCPWALAWLGRGARGRRRGLAGLRGDLPSHTSATRPTGVEGTGGSGGPGCGARGRWRGLAGLRGDAPSEARGADGSRAGRRPRAHRAARPTGQHVRRPEHPWGHKQHHQLGGPPPTGTYSSPARQSTCNARNTSGATQQPKPQKPNEKCPRKRQYSQLHSSTPKSHMRNMRAS